MIIYNSQVENSWKCKIIPSNINISTFKKRWKHLKGLAKFQENPSGRSRDSKKKERKTNRQILLSHRYLLLMAFFLVRYLENWLLNYSQQQKVDHFVWPLVEFGQKVGKPKICCNISIFVPKHFFKIFTIRVRLDHCLLLANVDRCETIFVMIHHCIGHQTTDFILSEISEWKKPIEIIWGHLLSCAWAAK